MAAAISALVGVCAASAAAQEDGGEWPTKVKLTFDARDDADYFEGVLLSPHPPCVKGRKVVIKNIDANETLGSDKTTARGEFELKLSGAADSGTYKAIAKKKVVRDGLCRKGTDTYEETHDGG